MTQKGENKAKLKVRTATKWRERARNDRVNRKQISRAQAFAIELLDYLDETKISQLELAQRMAVSAQQVNKIVRAKSNLTFDTIDKIAEALNVDITTPTIKSKKTIVSRPITSEMKLVYKSGQKQIEPIYKKSIEPSKNPILTTNLENIEPYEFTANQI